MSKKKTVAVPAIAVSPVQHSDVLTLEDVAAFLRVSNRWVYEKTRRRCPNPLPTIRIGRYVRFLKPQIDAWLRSQSGAA